MLVRGLNALCDVFDDSRTRRRLRIAFAFVVAAFFGVRAEAQAALRPRLNVALGARLNAVAASDGVFAAAGEPVAGVTAITVWDAESGKVARKYEMPSTAVYCLAFSPDGRFLAAGCGDGTVRLWRQPAGRAAQWQASESSVLAIAFSPDSRTLVSAGADRVARLWDANSARLIRALNGHFASVFSVAFDERGSRLASGGADGVVLVWDVEAAVVRSEWRNHRDVVSAVAFVPGTNELVTAGWDGRALLTDMATGTAETLADTSALVYSAAVSPSGDQLAVSLSEDVGSGTLRLWHLPSRSLLTSFDSASNRAVAYFVDRGSIVAGTSAGDVRVWAFAPKTPSLLVADAAKTNEFRWTATDALGYEVQATRTLPFRDNATTVVVRDAEWTPLTGFNDGETIFWRVRALGFGASSEWSETRSVRWVKRVEARPAVRVLASNAHVKVEDEFDIYVVVENASELAGFEFALVVEPPLISVSEVAEGDALRADDLEAFWNVPVVSAGVNALRITDIAGARIRAAGVNVASGRLLTVRAKALRAGEMTVRIENARLATGSGKLIDTDAYPLTLAIVTTFLAGDVNRDGIVDVFDLVYVAQRFGLRVALSGDDRADVNGDGAVDIRDLLVVVRQFGDTTRGPAIAAGVSRRVTAAEIAAWRYLERSLESLPEEERATPEWAIVAAEARRQTDGAATPILQASRNYPNPFNPETWIPFRLGEPATIIVSIWNAQGEVVRVLFLGARNAGSDEAHWDGRGGDGTPCASGVYVVRIEARTTSENATAIASRRVVLRK